jgi:hypothetical protein
MAAVRSLPVLAAAPCLLLIGAACGGSGDGGASPTIESRCKGVPPALVNAIATGLTVPGGGTLRKAQAVKSNDKDVWFISADIDGPGMHEEDDIGTWAKSGPLAVGDGLILSVGSLAQEFSDWGHGDTTDANLAMDDDGAQESYDCVESR